MNKNIITISREYGSGGHIIGKKVAEELGFAFYDKEVVAMIAEESGYAEDFIEYNAENKAKNTSYDVFNVLAGTGYALGMYAGSGFDMSASDRMHAFQTKVINEIADKGPCVIIGRCADYILKERNDCLNIFIHADKSIREERAVSEYGIAPQQVKKEVDWQDKTRTAYYKYYTENQWGFASNYHLTLDSGVFGVEGCVEIITHIASR